MHHCILNNLFQNPMNREIENNASMVFHNWTDGCYYRAFWNKHMGKNAFPQKLSLCTNHVRLDSFMSNFTVSGFPQSSLEHFSFILFHYDVCKRVLTFHAVAWFFSPSLALFLPACVCTDLLLSSCSSHNSQLIGSRSGHDTAERGSERDDGNSWARFPFSFSVETARAFSLFLLLLLLSSLLFLLPGFLFFN